MIERFAGLLFLSASYLVQPRKLSTRLGEVRLNVLYIYKEFRTKRGGPRIGW